MDIDLTPKFKKIMAPRARVIGRFNSSELYGITHPEKGWMTPEKWLNPPERSVKEMLTMWYGTGTHNQIENLLGGEYSEKKVEYKYRDIVLVAKADYLPAHKPNQVWEFKTSLDIIKKAKPWQLHQVKLYCTAFERKEGIVYQPVVNNDGIYLKEIGKEFRNDGWFEAEMAKLYEFHQRVLKLIK